MPATGKAVTMSDATAPERDGRLGERPWLAHYEPGVPAEVEIPVLTYDGLLRRAAERFPDRVALSFFGATQTFRTLDEAVDRFACHIDALGLRPGERVSLHLPTSPAFVIAFLGTLRAGALAVPMSPLLVERELVTLLRETTPRLSVSLDLLVPRVREARRRLADALPSPVAGADLLVTGIVDSMKAPLRWLYPIKARREGRWHPVADSADTPNLFRCLSRAPGWRFESAGQAGGPAALVPTGGTTGVPKAAVLTHRNLVANAAQVASWFPDAGREPGSVLCALPYFHSYGLTVDLGYALMTGSTQILLPRFDVDQILKAIGQDRPRLFPGAPLFYSALLEDPGLERHDLSSIEACISGSAPLPPDLQARFESVTHGRVSEGYGLTEASPVTHCNPINGTRKTGTIGLPFPSTDARVVDLDTGWRTLPPGEVGELCVRGPQVFEGYWGRPEETAHVLRDGWLHTGDLATMDEDGFFTIVDRLKDLIIVSGVNVYPSTIEEVLVAHPAVAEAVVVGRPDARRGEAPMAFVVPAPGQTVRIEELQAWCHDRLSSLERPVEIELREEIPRSPLGKILRRELHDSASVLATPPAADPVGDGTSARR
jgi:long-chain acyl-CoA synthetase